MGNRVILTSFEETQKRRIQSSLLEEFGRSYIGTDVARYLAFPKLIEILFTEHFSLCSQSGRKLEGEEYFAGFYRLTQSAHSYYQKRADHLSVTDFVTDLLDIVHNADLAVAPR